MDWQYYTAQNNIPVLNLKGITIGIAKSKSFNGEDIHGDIVFYKSLNYPTWHNAEIRVGENDVYIQKIRYFSLEAKCNDKSIQRIIHCPCCDKNIVVEELNPELNKN